MVKNDHFIAISPYIAILAISLNYPHLQTKSSSNLNFPGLEIIKLPIDSFLFFDSGFRVLNGHFPFKDFWAVTGLTVDIIQALFFKIFGVSWFSYVLHASFLNFLIAFATFYTLYKFELNINFCFLYALLISIIAYPISGTPFPDHHSIIFSLFALSARQF